MTKIQFKIPYIHTGKVVIVKPRICIIFSFLYRFIQLLSTTSHTHSISQKHCGNGQSQVKMQYIKHFSSEIKHILILNVIISADVVTMCVSDIFVHFITPECAIKCILATELFVQIIISDVGSGV